MLINNNMSDTNEVKMNPEQNREVEFQEIAKQNFSFWNEALLTGKKEEVAKLYADGATFLPTMSSEFEKGQSGAKNYFQHFLEKNPESKVVNGVVQILGDDSYLHSGMYNFKVGPDDNRQVAEARFTFVWKKNKAGEWKIIHHHSSAKPNA